MKSCRRRVVGLVLAVVASALLAAPSSAGASAATRWNLNATNALIATGGQPPPVSMLHLAMVHGAMYDAVNAIDGGYTPYLASPNATPFDSQDAAAATAAYYVLKSILPSQLGTLTTTYNTDPAIDSTVTPDSPAKAGGIAAGIAAANAMITARATDGRFGACCFSVPAVPGPGDWRPLSSAASANDPNGWIRNVTPFMIRSSSQFRTKGPYALTSPQYAREFNEVKALGIKDPTKTTRTQHQTDAALYWSQHPPRTWGRIVRGLETERGLSTADGARLYAQIYLTGADAAISIWDDKEHWGFWRPITAIQQAASDGNPATVADPTWDSLVLNPPYSDHPSGHLGVSGSHIETLQEFFHTDQMAWTDTTPATPTQPAITMSYSKLSDALEEIISVRVWSGIHFRNADEQSAHLAKQIAKWRKHHYFKKAH